MDRGAQASQLLAPPAPSCLHRPQVTGTQPHLPWPTPRWWFLLWGVLQAFPTQGSVVLLAQWLPQKLTSPGYPEPYVKGQESSTDIEAPEGYAVRLLFQDFDLEPSPYCERDSVTVSWVGFWRDSTWGGPLLEAQGSGRGPGPETRGSPGRPGLPAEGPCLPVHPAIWAPPTREKATGQEASPRDTQTLQIPRVKSKKSHISH